MVKRAAVGITISAVIILATSWLVSCAPVNSALPFRPHINPNTTSAINKDVSTLRYMAWGLDLILTGKPEELRAWGQRLQSASIRPEAIEAAMRFYLSASGFLGYIEISDTEIDTIISLAKQHRLDEAKQLAYALLQRLPQAAAELDEMETSFKIVARMVGALRASEGSDLIIIYKEGQRKLFLIRQAIELLTKSLKGGDIEALYTELQGRPDLRQYLAMAETMKKALEVELQRTELTLEIAPRRAFVGDSVVFHGQLTTGVAPVPGKDITLELDGRAYAVARTGSGGYYAGEFRLPYTYGEMTGARVRYLPVGPDTDVYLPSMSPPVEVETLFYISGLHLEVPARGYPGVSLIIKGRFNYGDPPTLGAREIEMFIDSSPAGSATVSQDFQIELPVDNSLSLGRHQIAIVAPGQGRYGPASAAMSIDVVKAVPVVSLETPRLALLPWSLEIQGKAESEVAPLNAARIRLMFGQRMAETTTAADGNFHYRLNPGFLFTVIGRESLEVQVIPREPWDDAVSVERNILVFNPGGFALILVSGIIVTRQVMTRKRAKSLRPQVAMSPSSRATESLGQSFNVPGAEPSGQRAMTQGAPRDAVLELYRWVMRSIMASLGIMVRPHLTLRELVKELSPRLGVVASYLWQMTLIVERAIYSRHPLAEKDKSDIEKLSAQVTEGIKHGPD